MTDQNNLTDDECKKVLNNLIKRFENLYSNSSNNENVIEAYLGKGMKKD